MKGIVTLVLLAAFPFAAGAFGQEFYVGFVARVMIFALAATSLGLILGFGGMASLGHAAFFGLGAYTVALLMDRGVASAWIAWPCAMLVAALFAAAIGAVSLRTRGVYFIMITLAFAQMVYYLVVSARALGGDDGMPIPVRVGGQAFYYLVLAIVAASIFGLQRLVTTPFGRALQAIRDNDERAEAIGIPVFRVKLAAFVIAGAFAGLAGALLAHQNGLVSPSLLAWQQSGLLMAMVILGGMRSPWGGALGAATVLVIEEALTGVTVHWKLALGGVLLVVVWFSAQGLAGFARLGRRNG